MIYLILSGFLIRGGLLREGIAEADGAVVDREGFSGVRFSIVTNNGVDCTRKVSSTCMSIEVLVTLAILAE